ncbi:hypothetical protein CEXT_431611 [Caerostris extrusa]|uniref:Uncharacterized protein n=1 Tax=Caerostris extrusa TaxID=172846 RepID=A0AAV4NB59_CAEEX|nr:hypothetical protein CEXT_431611 [Caerostris extrusa]
MSQNKVRKHLQTLSTKTKRKQKFVKDEIENRQLPILKINLRNLAVCEVARTDYPTRRIASKNEDNEDRNISSSESILHKFPKSNKVCLTNNVGSKPLAENVNINKKRRRENLKVDFSEMKKKRRISDSKSQEPHDIVDSFESNFNKFAKCIENNDKGTEALETSFLIKWDHSYTSSTLPKSSQKFKPHSVKVNDNASNSKEMCDKYMGSYIEEYKAEEYREEVYTDEELVLFPHLSDIEIYFKQDLPDIGTLLCPINIDSCLQMGVSHQEEVTTSESETSLQMGVSHQEVTTSELEATLSNDIFLSINLPLEFIIDKYLLSGHVFKENNHSSSMAVKKSAFHLPVVEIHRNTVNTINNKSINAVKGESIIQSGKQLVSPSKLVLNICTYKTPAKNKQATYIGKSAIQAQTNKKPAVNTNKCDVNGQATYKRSMNIRSNVNHQIDMKQKVNKAKCIQKQRKKSCFDVHAFLSLRKLDLNFKIPKKPATSNAKTSP